MHRRWAAARQVAMAERGTARTPGAVPPGAATPSRGSSSDQRTQNDPSNLVPFQHLSVCMEKQEQPNSFSLGDPGSDSRTPVTAPGEAPRPPSPAQR